MSDLARGAGKPHAPLFAPLVFAAAAQIEALSIAAFVADAVKLGKGLSDLRRLLDLSAITVAVPALMEAEALGAEVDFTVWPPRLLSSPGNVVLGIDDFTVAFNSAARVQASLDVTRRLAQAESSQPVLIAVLTGPATLAQQLLPSASPAEEEAAFDFAGRALTALTRLYCEAGINALVLREDALPAATSQEHWSSALAPIANTARFHKVPPLLMIANGEPEAEGWPVPCIAASSTASAFEGRAHALVMSADPAAWHALPDGADNTRLVLTANEVDAGCDLASLREKVAALR